MVGTLYRELTELLRAAGCTFVRQAKGSHEIWYSPISRRHFPFPSNITSRKLANKVLKDAGLPKAF
jgi:predicted RNA binding protein YcfA (HicA-like mRNA interferase family)